MARAVQPKLAEVKSRILAVRSELPPEFQDVPIYTRLEQMPSSRRLHPVDSREREYD